MTKPLTLFRALADPTRLRIVALLRAMELSVGELAQVLGQSQPRVSRHVKILCDARIARRRKEGSWVFLLPGEAAVTDTVFAMIDARNATGDHWAVADAARLVAVRADRAKAAEEYFALHAEQWDAIRSLHVAESEVDAAILSLLDGESVGRLVDIGTGTGGMIALLGKNAEHITGIDRSPEMLRLARAKLSEAGAAQVDLQQGDVARLPVADASADTVTIHQVLHYLPSPEIAIAEAARVLVPGGRLLIADFAAHDREELRTQDAHARLGFEDGQMERWFAGSGLAMERIDTLSGGTLTVKLWLGRRAAGSGLKVIAA
jgi:ubiquinone/menaquinone biosynthesis C-methylase UbiE